MTELLLLFLRDCLTLESLARECEATDASLDSCASFFQSTLRLILGLCGVLAKADLSTLDFSF